MTGRVTAVVSAYYAEEYFDGRITNLLIKTNIRTLCGCTKGSKDRKLATDNVLTILTNEFRHL
jgi:hypothetical protein